MARKLFIKDVEVKVGDIVTDFRGNKAFVTGFEEPYKSSSSGHIYVKWCDWGKDEQMSDSYYPSVFGAEFEVEK